MYKLMFECRKTLRELVMKEVKNQLHSVSKCIEEPLYKEQRLHKIASKFKNKA